MDSRVTGESSLGRLPGRVGRPTMRLLTPIGPDDFGNGKSNIIEFEQFAHDDNEVDDDDSCVEDEDYCDGETSYYDGTPFDDLSPCFTSLCSNELLKKRIKRTGLETFGLVNERSSATINYTLFLDGDSTSFDSTYERGRPERFNLASCSLLIGIQRAILTMKKAEIAEFLIHYSLGYGDMGCIPRIPSKANILAIIEIIDFVNDTEADKLLSTDPDQRNQENAFDYIYKVASMLNQEGNNYVGNKEWLLAAKRYLKGTRLLEEVELENEVQELQMSKLLLKLLLNLGYCYIKTARAGKACLTLQKALKIDGQNIKGNYRMGLAKQMVGNREEALNYLFKAHKLSPSDESIGARLLGLEDEIRADKENEKILCRKMFGLRPSEVKLPKEEPLDDEWINDVKYKIDNFLASTEENVYLPLDPSNPSIFEKVKKLGVEKNLKVSKIDRPCKLIKISKFLD